MGGTALTAFGLRPLSRIVGRPFEWFFGAEGLLGRANLGRDRARTGLTVGALIIALSAVVTLGAVAESARATADRWVGSILPGGYAIRIPLPVDIASKQADFDSTTGAAAASPIVEFAAVVREGSVQREASVAGIEPNVFQATGSLIFVTGSPGALPSTRCARAAPSWSPSRSPTATTSASGRPSSWPSRGRRRRPLPWPASSRTPCRPARRTALCSSAWPTPATDSAPPRPPCGRSSPSRESRTLHSARQSAAKATENAAELLTARDLASDLERSLDRLIGLFDVLALLAVVIAGLGIVNTLGVSVVERAREIAILRSHGMTTGQVQAMVVAEAAIMGAIGGIAAVVTGVLMSWAVVGGTTPRDFGAGLAIPWPLLISVVLLGTGVAALASLYPARLAARIPIVGSIAHFE